jgi:putative adhesin/ice-binding like protein
MLSISPKSFLPIAASLILLGAVQAKADVSGVIPEIGDLERWTVFSLGDGNNFSRAFGHSLIDGDLGLAGNGNFLMGGHATINGDVYDRSNGTVLTFQNAFITGSIFHDQDALLDNGVNEALAASAHAFSLTPNRPNTSVKLLGNHALTITGAPGETVVLNLKNFILRDNSSFTLQGTATTTFVINVRKKFSLSGNSHIDLAGLQWNQVLFNVVGAGQRVSLGGSSVFNGILMANDRTIKMKGDATVFGELIANRFKLRGSSRVLHPPIISPLVDTLSEADFDGGSRDHEMGESMGRGVMGRKLK